MKFEVVEENGAWIVRRDGVELGRHTDQAYALDDVSTRLRALDSSPRAVSLAMRYATRD